jgi:hypothetical protein
MTVRRGKFQRKAENKSKVNQPSIKEAQPIKKVNSYFSILPLESENILGDESPIYAGYSYLVNNKYFESPITTTVKGLKNYVINNFFIDHVIVRRYDFYGRKRIEDKILIDNMSF